MTPSKAGFGKDTRPHAGRIVIDDFDRCLFIIQFQNLLKNRASLLSRIKRDFLDFAFKRTMRSKIIFHSDSPKMQCSDAPFPEFPVTFSKTFYFPEARSDNRFLLS